MLNINSQTLDELAAKIGAAFQSSPAKDLEKNVKTLLSSGLAKLDVVTRAEFDIQREVLQRTREKVEKLEVRVAQLEARSAGADAIAFARGGAQEAARGAGDVHPPHPPRDHAGDEEILLDEIGQRLADAVLVARDDRGVGDGQAERVAEQGGDREPVGEPADHAGLRKGFDPAEPGIERLILSRAEKHRRHQHQ